jgi:hypothetical protein
MGSVLQSMPAFINWLQQTPFSLTVATVIWIVPLVQTVHILGIALVMGSIVLFDLRLLNAGMRSLSLAAAGQRFLPWLWFALPLLLLSGLLLIIGEPERSLTNPLFYAKMIMVLTAALISWCLQRALRKRPAGGLVFRFFALVSLALWVAIVFAGRWIAYV